MPPARVLVTPPRVAIALGGGAFHGAAHVGVLKALEENKIPIDLIVGTSAGSLVGALYCDNPDAGKLIPLVLETKSSTVFDFSLIRSKVGFVSGKKLQKYVSEHCNAKNIEETKIPFIAVATDLLAGKSVPLASGPIAPSVNASCAIPMIFEPVKMYGMTFVDGGILDNIPADICYNSKAKVVIAVDIMADTDSLKNVENFLQVLYKSLLLALGENKKAKLAHADIVITPDLRNMTMLSGKQNQQIFDSGYIAAMRMMPEIKKMLRSKGISIE
ncbi:MAG: patatin-like phospholipase family protein [Bacteroidetes bacterium]|nr:patatin-like phospholipase family protein [Bacteroidota bacterium]